MRVVCISLVMLARLAAPVAQAVPQDPAESSETTPDTSPPGDDATTAKHRWHIPRRSARKGPRHPTHPPAEDGNPLAGPMSSLKAQLKELGIMYDIELAFLGQKASDVDMGDDSLTTLSWEIMGDWKVLEIDGSNDGFLAWDIFGGVGLGYEIDSKSLSANVGTISTVNLSDLLDEPAIVDELFWKQELADEDGWGVGASFDQALGTGDTVAAAVAWSDPSDSADVRSETLIEAYYQLELSPSVFLAPSIQVIFDPGLASDDDTIVVGGLRPNMRF